MNDAGTSSIPEPPAADQALAQRLWSRYAASPGVISRPALQRLTARVGISPLQRFPLLSIYQRWADAAALSSCQPFGTTYTWPFVVPGYFRSPAGVVAPSISEPPSAA